MNPLVATGIAIFVLYIVCVAVWFYATNNEHCNTKMRLRAQRWREMMQDGEDDCPEWADKVKWRESLK